MTVDIDKLPKDGYESGRLQDRSTQTRDLEMAGLLGDQFMPSAEMVERYLAAQHEVTTSIKAWEMAMRKKISSRLQMLPLRKGSEDMYATATLEMMPLQLLRCTAPLTYHVSAPIARQASPHD